MKSKRILHALGQVDEFYVNEAANVTPRPKKHHLTRWGALAACLCLVAGGAFFFTNKTGSSRSYDSFPDEVIVSEDGVTIPPTKATLGEEDGVEYCWAYAFFIYQGHCYKSYNWVYSDSDLIGEHLGYVTGMIDLWTPKKGYVELAGNTKGDFYSVKGYDPEFMLCMRDSSGVIRIFINDNNLTLKYCSDLLENRFRISSNLKELVYQNHNSWNYSKGELYTLNNTRAISDFIALLNQGTFIPETQALLPNGAEYLSQAALYHVDLRMSNGTTVELTLVEGGYIDFGIYFPGVCLKVDEAKFDELIVLLDSGADTVPAETQQNERLRLTMDECLADPYFSSYIPSYVPENMSFQYGGPEYEIDSKTGEFLQTKEIYLGYRDDQDYTVQYSITIASVDDHGNISRANKLIFPEEVTPETIAQYADTTWKDGTPKEYSDTHFGVQFGDVIVVFSAYGLDAGEAYQIMTSIYPE